MSSWPHAGVGREGVGQREAGLRKRVATRPLHSARLRFSMWGMNMPWLALILAAACISGVGAGCANGRGQHPPFPCALPDGGGEGGERCSCPGFSVQLFNPPAGCPPFTCLGDGTWAPYDAACLTNASEAGS